jgi:hypothetical protein
LYQVRVTPSRIFCAGKREDAADRDVSDSDCPQPLGAATSMPSDPNVEAYGMGMGGNFSDHKFSENCLTLNIWTKPQTGERKKAVMVWIYGGGET